MNYVEVMENNWEEFKNKNKMPTIAILGCTGSGKSSLINTIFGEKVAPVSDVTPQTQEFTLYPGDKEKEIYVNLMDSKGYELTDGNGQEYISKLKDEIERYESEGTDINVVWFCISVGKKRVEEIDKIILKGVSEIEKLRNKVMCVITQCDTDDEEGSIARSYKEELKEVLPSLKIFEVSTSKNCELELEDLIAQTAESLTDEDLKRSFISSQKRNIDLKKEEASKAIKKYIAIAGTAGATPIPFSDSLILIPTQLKMISEITGIYGIRNLENITQGIVTETVVGTFGKSVAGSLIKLIPGVGTVIGGAINASVASSITYGLGRGISELSYKSCQDILAGKESSLLSVLNSGKFTDIVTKYIHQAQNEGV